MGPYDENAMSSLPHRAHSSVHVKPCFRVCEGFRGYRWIELRTSSRFGKVDRRSDVCSDRKNREIISEKSDQQVRGVYKGFTDGDKEARTISDATSDNDERTPL